MKIELTEEEAKFIIDILKDDYKRCGHADRIIKKLEASNDW